MTDHPDNNTGRAASIPAQNRSSLQVSRRKVWLFRFMAVFIVPAVLVCLLELLLRLVGFGHPTAFLLPATYEGEKGYVQNYQFGWRFFGRKLSRRPNPLFISRTKEPDVARVFVFGESAAYGDPRPSFGLPRMLEAVLEFRHPGVRFEVENMAMTGINSHVIVPIAQDCARANGDVWVVYMGNNEVVGPFGAGTVFGSQTLPLPLVRASLQARSTRTGQLLDTLLELFQRPRTGKDHWSGMEMFLHQQVAADDPRISRVYGNFERNLADILAAGKRSGAGIVLSTVAVNLKDCPPFASAHRPELSETDLSRWETLYKAGTDAMAAGSNELAMARFQEAVAIDDRFAELRFRLGQTLLTLGKTAEAREHFTAARDLDTLQFRCDSRLNNLIRRAAASREQDGIRIADAEALFGESSPDGLPGETLFYEHVHLTFDGNYLLARTIAEQVESLLTAAATSRPPQPWPTREECAARLAWSDFTHAESLGQILGRLTQPPFTGQLGHEARIQRFRSALEELMPSMETGGLEVAEKACEQALKAAPDDPVLYSLLAFLKRNRRDLAGAVDCARRAVELCPSDAHGWRFLGVILVQQGNLADAQTAFNRAVELDPHDAMTRLSRANVLLMAGNVQEATSEYNFARRLQPSLSSAWIALGQISEKNGRREEAQSYYKKVLENNTDVAQSPVVARFCQSLGWLEAAATNYDEAIKLDPTNVRLRLSAGKNLADLKRYAPAIEQCREAVRLKPEFIEARIALGAVLAKEGRNSEALEQFEVILRASPTNSFVLDFVRELKTKPDLQKVR